MSRPRDPYDWVESWAWPIIERGRLPGCADLVLLRLAAHGNAAGTARPSARGLAKQVGRSERAVRGALDALRDLGYIDGKPAPRCVTTWRLVIDEDDQQRLREDHLRTRPPQTGSTAAALSADPSSADDDPPSADHLRTICGPSADPSRDEGEGEGEEHLSLSANGTAARGEGEEMVDFDPTNLVALRKLR